MKPIALVVDDNPINRQILEAALHKIADVRMAANGEEALAEIKAHRPAVVFLDLMMPKMDGFGVIDELASAQDAILEKTVVVTANADDETRDRCLSGGVNDVFAKPVVVKEIIERFEALAKDDGEREEPGSATG